MKHLWAPWRMEFIEGEKPIGCVFCRVLTEKDDKTNLLLHRTEDAFVMLNKYPYNNGHLMVIPIIHSHDFSTLSKTVATQMMALTQESISVLTRAYRPEGFNVGMNLGAAAGAGIKDHLHLHIVPRWGGDTNFMPVLSETKAMPQHLSHSYDLLKEAWSHQ